MLSMVVSFTVVALLGGTALALGALSDWLDARDEARERAAIADLPQPAPVRDTYVPTPVDLQVVYLAHPDAPPAGATWFGPAVTWLDESPIFDQVLESFSRSLPGRHALV